MKRIGHRYQTDLEFAIKVKRAKRILKYASVILPVFVLLYFLNSLSKNQDQTSKSNRNEVIKYESQLPRVPDNEAWVISRRFVKDYLKAPSTADFPFEKIYVSVSNDTYTVIAPVDAQNSFGAQIRSTFICQMIYLGGKTYSEESWKPIAVAVE